MNDLAPLSTLADHQPGPSNFGPLQLHTTNGYSPAAEDAVEDDDSSTIKCFCGYNDDDGSTVFCEDCKTWQHTYCYYGVVDPADVPDIHQCIDCLPRAVNTKRAAEYQRQKRSQAGDRKPKRPPSKSHKKKVKDLSQFPVQNGFAVPSDQPQPSEQTNGSPRDQQPPSKRPKTSHRTSSSTSALNHPSLAPQPRRRGTSITSPAKSPHSPTLSPWYGEYFSQEFMRLHRTSYTKANANFYTSLSVSNDLRTWLHDVESLKAVTGGLTQQSVFHRWDDPFEDLEQTSPGFSKSQEANPDIRVRGEYPVMQWLTADVATGPEAYIGELKGKIGRIDEYYRDPNNRWEELHHPEPYVFFHDKLPIYIDCRSEGNSLRFLRRSCQPNVKMQIIIHGTDFHFCMISMRPIAAGEELTVPWHIRGREFEILKSVNENKNVSQMDLNYMSSWFTGVLTNFGGCACNFNPSLCGMSRFDLRTNSQLNGTGLMPSQVPAYAPRKIRKTKKAGPHISPLSTGRATNSRAASEAVLRDEIEDELGDSRSTSRSKPSSRDITPMGQMSEGSVGLGVMMSEREKRKLQQQEALFQKLENEEGPSRKKRNSGGSALNTPKSTLFPRRKSIFDDNSAANVGATSSSAVTVPCSENTSRQILARIRASRNTSYEPAYQDGVAANQSKLERDAAHQDHVARLHPPRFDRPTYNEASTQVDPKDLWTNTYTEGEWERREARYAGGYRFETRQRRTIREARARLDALGSWPTPEEKAERLPLVEQMIEEEKFRIHMGGAWPGPLIQSMEKRIARELAAVEGLIQLSRSPTPAPATNAAPSALVGQPPVSSPSVNVSSNAQPSLSSPATNMHSSTLGYQPSMGNTSVPSVPIASEDSKDVNMEDADAAARPTSLPSPVTERNETLSTTHTLPTTRATDEAELPPPTQPATSASPTGLRIDLPPVPIFAAQTTQTPTTPSAPSVTNPPPLPSPALANVPAPSPMRKKISLSDYSNRKARQANAAQVQSSSLVTGIAGTPGPNTNASSSPTEGNTQDHGPA